LHRAGEVDTALARARGWWRSRRTNLDPAAVLSLWWCAALLAHYDHRGDWAISPEAAASAVASAVGMLVARSALVVGAVAALQLAAMWGRFPRVDNHWAFAGFVDLAIVGATVTWAIRRRAPRQPIGPLDDDWYGLVAPLVRALVILMYCFAVFHKLNLGFFDPDESCAVAFFHRMTRTPLVPLWPQALEGAEAHATIGAVLAIEAGIPILLAGRRTWCLGIALGVSFHLSTGMFMRHYPSIMMALYWVFVPVEVQRRWIATIEAWLRRATRGRLGYVGVVLAHSAALTALSVACAAVQMELGIKRFHPDAPSWWVLRGWNLFVAVGSIVGWLALVRSGGVVAHPPGRFRCSAGWLHAVSIVFVVNCLSPYLGLKTITSLNMWSNLVVTDETNHLLLSGDAIRVFDYTSDVVRVRSSSDAEIAAWARSRSVVAWSTLRAEAQRAVKRARESTRKVQVTYERAGVLHRVSDVAVDAVLMEPRSYLERKLVQVKPVSGHRPARCEW
jgi:hypothetical protein